MRAPRPSVCGLHDPSTRAARRLLSWWMVPQSDSCPRNQRPLGGPVGPSLAESRRPGGDAKKIGDPKSPPRRRENCSKNHQFREFLSMEGSVLAKLCQKSIDRLRTHAKMPDNVTARSHGHSARERTQRAEPSFRTFRPSNLKTANALGLTVRPDEYDRIAAYWAKMSNSKGADNENADVARSAPNS